MADLQIRKRRKLPNRCKPWQEANLSSIAACGTTAGTPRWVIVLWCFPIYVLVCVACSRPLPHWVVNQVGPWRGTSGGENCAPPAQRRLGPIWKFPKPLATGRLFFSRLLVRGARTARFHMVGAKRHFPIRQCDSLIICQMLSALRLPQTAADYSTPWLPFWEISPVLVFFR